MRVVALLVALVGVLAGALPLTGPARAEARIALVIGNAGYTGAISPLRNPANDARLMAATLSQLGFQATLVLNADQATMKSALVAFGDRLEAAGPDAVALFYYAGHGMAAQGENYLLPIGAEIDSERELPVDAVPASLVLTQMQFSGSRLNFLILDACRNNPLARGTRSGSRGLERMDAPRGTLIVYATEPGNVAVDGSGDNSPFTLALTEAMRVPGIDAQLAVRRARVQVMAATGERQVPWEEGGLTRAFYFTPAAAPAPPAAPVTMPDRTDPSVAAWHALGATPRREDLLAFIQAFPTSPLTPLARHKLSQLGDALQAPAPLHGQTPIQPPPLPTPSPPPVVASLPPAQTAAAPLLFPESGVWNGARGTVSITVTVTGANFAVRATVGNSLLRGTGRFADAARPRRLHMSLIGRGTSPSVQLSGEFPALTVTCLASLTSCPSTNVTLERQR